MSRSSATIRAFVIVCAISLLVLFGGLLRSALLASLAEVREGDPPQLVLSQPNLDFAEVTPGQNLKGYIGLRNVGGQRLFVHKAASDCACCEDESNAPLIIGPNNDGRLPVELVAPSHLDAMTRILSFETNDPNLPRFSVAVRASIKCPVRSKKESVPGT